MHRLSNIDKNIIRSLMQGLPLIESPYRAIGRRLGVNEDFIFKRVQNLKTKGIIKKINAVFDWRKLGYSGSLIALKVPPKKIKGIARFINGFSVVTHNYLRNYKFNLWFQIIYKKEKDKEKILDGLKSRGITEILELPSIKNIKLDTSGLL